MTTKTKVFWFAGDKRGNAHAFRKPGLLRALCGAPTIHERFSWPTVSHCPTCSVKLGELV